MATEERVTTDKGGEIVEIGRVDPLEAMKKCEALFEQRLALAVKATSVRDWKNMGGNPYLCETGAQKVGARFGISLEGLEIERENLEDENGTYYVYTAKVTAVWPAANRTVEEMGVCSSRDQFFGSTKEGLKKMQDVDIVNIKKSAITNAHGRAILKVLGLGGLTWEDLAKFGITPQGKASVQYKSGGAKAVETKKTAKAESESKRPYWSSEYNGRKYVFAREGFHFTQEFLDNLGMKPSEKQAGLYFGEWNQDIEAALAEEFEAAESVKATDHAMAENGGAS